jgi:hypothetical protein
MDYPGVGCRTLEVSLFVEAVKEHQRATVSESVEGELAQRGWKMEDSQQRSGKD